MTCAFVVTDMSAQEPNEFELADIDEQTPSVTDQTQPRDSIVALEQQQIHDDSQLRVQGYPQSLLYILRAGGLSTDQIRRLPAPSFDSVTGKITDDYFFIIRDHFGVDETVLPSQYHSTSPVRKPGNHFPINPHKWTREEEIRFYGSGEVSEFSRPRSAPPYSNSPSHLAARFGSPVFSPARRLSYDLAPTPPSTVSGSRIRSARLNENSRSFTPIRTDSSTSPGIPLSANPTGQGVGTTGTDPSDTHYIDHIDIAVSTSDWHFIRQGLNRTGTCNVLHAFAFSDKQFQQLLQASKVPPSLKQVGTASFDPESWQDLFEWFQAVDVWNVFAAIYCKAFRAILSNEDSISLGGREVARIMQDVPLIPVLGYSAITTALSRWHLENIVNHHTLLYASLSSFVMRDRII